MKYNTQILAKKTLAISAGLIGLYAMPASAATCSITATPIAFGQYNTVTRAAVNTMATVTVLCSGFFIAENYTISVSAGQSGNGLARYLSSGNNKLQYQVYVDSARTLIAGDGSGGTSVLGSNMTPLIGFFTASRTETLYSSILTGQNAAPGAYTDMLSLVITY